MSSAIGRNLAGGPATVWGPLSQRVEHSTSGTAPGVLLLWRADPLRVNGPGGGFGAGVGGSPPRRPPSCLYSHVVARLGAMNHTTTTTRDGHRLSRTTQLTSGLGLAPLTFGASCECGERFRGEGTIDLRALHAEHLTDLEDDGGEDTPAPGPWIICPDCDGEGVHALHGIAFTHSEMMEQGEDFIEDYRAGHYDTPCECCGGRGSVRQADIDAYHQRLMDTRQSMRENGEW